MEQRKPPIRELRVNEDEQKKRICSFLSTGDPNTQKFFTCYCRGRSCGNIISFSDGTVKCGRT